MPKPQYPSIISTGRDWYIDVYCTDWHWYVYSCLSGRTAAWGVCLQPSHIIKYHISTQIEHRNTYWLVVSTSLNPSERYESRLGWLFPINGKCSKPPTRLILNTDTYSCQKDFSPFQHHLHLRNLPRNRFQAADPMSCHELQHTCARCARGRPGFHQPPGGIQGDQNDMSWLVVSTYNVRPPFGSVQLVNITPISLWFMVRK